MPKLPKITKDNYYSPEINAAYWSASFIKQMLDCPARAMAELRGEYVQPSTTALLVGSYVDAYFEGRLDEYILEHPEFFKRDGTMKNEFQRADAMIKKAESDPVFMEFMRGEKQVIKTGYIGGFPFKAKFDVYLPGERIVDLKTTKDTAPVYKAGQGRISFAEAWNWPLQMAIYQRLEGNALPCYLAVITKQDPPDIEIIEIEQHTLDAEIEVLLDKLPYFDAIRDGVIEPERCEKCAYCRATKVITEPKTLDKFVDYEGDN